MEFANLDISGLRSGRAANSVRSALEAIGGVSEVRVVPEKGQATLRYDPSKVWPNQLRVAVCVVGCQVHSITLEGEDRLN